MPLSFKFVSSGQAVDDAATVAQTLRGNSLKPLAPYNLRARRDASNNIFLQWDRRARIAPGLRPGTSVPLAEELERYIVEAYLDSTLKNTYQVQSPPPFAPFLIDRSGREPDGTVTGFQNRQITSIPLDANRSWVEAVVDYDNSPLAAAVGIVDGPMTSSDDGTGVITWAGSWTMTAGVSAASGLGVIENGVSVYTQGVAYAELTAKIRVALKDNRILYYLDPNGENDAPLFVSARTDISGRDIRGYFFQSDYITQHKLRSSMPNLFYTAVQQTADGLTPGNAIKFRVYQVSAIVGRGPYVEATI